MLKRHEVEILLKAGHAKTEVARLRTPRTGSLPQNSKGFVRFGEPPSRGGGPMQKAAQAEREVNYATENGRSARRGPRRTGNGNSESGMEKIITCTKCRKTFKVSGPHSRMKEVPHGVTCPFCGESNEVMWPMDTGFTTLPKKLAG